LPFYFVATGVLFLNLRYLKWFAILQFGE
jgi:hypothetical protein